MKKTAILFILFFFFFLFSKAVFGQTPTPTPTPDPEIIYPQNSSFCTDFEIEAKKSDQYTTVEEPSGGHSTNTENASGEVYLNSNNFPNFSQMEKDLTVALEKLLPQDLKEKMKIETVQGKTQAKEFVVGKGGDGAIIPPNKEKTPETKITHPSWLANLLGQTKILCGMFGTCPAPLSMEIKVEQSNQKINDEAYLTKCFPGKPADDKDSQPEQTQSQFEAPSFWQVITNVTRIIVDAVNDIFNWKVDKEKTTTLEARTRGQFFGGQTLATHATFLDNFIPEEMLYGTGSIFSNENNYKVVVEGNAQDTTKEHHYFGMAKVQLERCISLCGVYPAEFDISSIDPLCPSCDYLEYELGDVALDQINCQRQSDGSCDYCIPIGQDGIGPNCEGDPVCEGEPPNKKCCPGQYRQAKDYLERQPPCPLPYNANDCFDPSVCKLMTFKENPNGGYGACQYQNKNVCVRTDREQIGRCDAMCNWACCQGKK